MKLRIMLLCSLALLLFCSGCTSDQSSQQNQESPTTEPVQAEENTSAQPLLAADDLLNISPENLETPVYDRYTIAMRREKKLPLTLPAQAPAPAEKVVYLTFDDGPDQKNTPAVLDILKENNIHATFFVLGKNAELYPEVIRRIQAEGHAIGNHSYDHDYKKLYASPSAYLAEMQKTDDILYGILGMRPFIGRAPGGTAGHFNKSFYAALKENGYREYGWNISTADAAPNHPVAQDFIDNVLSQIEARPALASHSIVLMHSSQNHEETVKALPTIIKIFKDRGYHFAVITPLTPDAW